MIKIIVDSTCDLSEGLRKEYDIRVLPLSVVLNGAEYLDGLEIKLETMYDAMRNGVYPKTSQIRREHAEQLFSEYAGQGIPFIYLAFSSAMSGTCSLGRMVLSEVHARYPEEKMAVVDARGGSMATGLIALQAARMAKDGYSFEQILEQVSFMVEHIEHVFTIDDLMWAVKGGRLSRIAGKAGNLLGIKPILDVQQGAIQVIRSVRGKAKALVTVADMVASRAKDFAGQIVGITHADDLGVANKMKELVLERLPDCTVMIERIGCVLGAHLGLGGVGVYFLNRKPKIYLFE